MMKRASLAVSLAAAGSLAAAATANATATMSAACVGPGLAHVAVNYTPFWGEGSTAETLIHVDGELELAERNVITTPITLTFPVDVSGRQHVVHAKHEWVERKPRGTVERTFHLGPCDTPPPVVPPSPPEPPAVTPPPSVPPKAEPPRKRKAEERRKRRVERKRHKRAQKRATSRRLPRTTG